MTTNRISKTSFALFGAALFASVSLYSPSSDAAAGLLAAKKANPTATAADKATAQAIEKLEAAMADIKKLPKSAQSEATQRALKHLGAAVTELKGTQAKSADDKSKEKVKGESEGAAGSIAW